MPRGAVGLLVRGVCQHAPSLVTNRHLGGRREVLLLRVFSVAVLTGNNAANGVDGGYVGSSES